VAGVDQPTAPVAHVLVAGRHEQRASDVVAEIGSTYFHFRGGKLYDQVLARYLGRVNPGAVWTSAGQVWPTRQRRGTGRLPSWM
jgi:hypothetical protein